MEYLAAMMHIAGDEVGDGAAVRFGCRRFVKVVDPSFIESFRYCHGNEHCHGDVHPDAHADRDPDRDPHAAGNGNQYSDRYRDAHSNGNEHWDSDPDPNASANHDQDQNCNPSPDCHKDQDTNISCTYMTVNRFYRVDVFF
jgi:hypothetical protein